MIYLVITLFVIFLGAYYLNNREFISPSVLFSGSLLLGSIMAWLNQNRWSLNISVPTYLVVALGTLEFVVVGYVVHLVFEGSLRSTYTQLDSSISGTSQKTVNSSSLKVYMCMIIGFQLFSIIFIAKSVIDVTGNGNLSQAISVLNASAMSGNSDTQLTLPTSAILLYRFSFASGLFFGYFFARKFVLQHKFTWTYFIAFLLGAGTTLLAGSRGNVVYAIVTISVCFYFFSKQKNGWKKINNAKYLFFIALGLVFLISIFQWSASLLGRDVESFNLFQYLSIYVGAEFKNLDMYIRNGAFPVQTGIFGKETFYNLISPISKILHLGIQSYKLDLPFQSVNGFTLGNVYTTFYPWLYDFGYIGVVVLVAITAIVTQTIYSVARMVKTTAPFSLSILIYGYFSSFLALSFFSNKFFENINTNLIYYIIIWIILKLIFSRQEK